MRHLEDRLGIQLFVRATRSVTLTPVGSSYAAEVRETLDRLAAATVAMTGYQSSGTLNVSTLDAFAAKWLVPRLFRFRAPTAISTCACRRRRGWPTSSPTASRSVSGMVAGDMPASRPTCSSRKTSHRCAARSSSRAHTRSRRLADLKHHTLIHDDFHIDWAMWLRTAGVEGVDPHRGPKFQSSDHVVQAAILGEGVALGRSPLVADDIASGRLVQPFTFRLPAELAYYVVYPPRAIQRHKIKVFRDWLLAEAAGEADRAATVRSGDVVGVTSSG